MAEAGLRCAQPGAAPGLAYTLAALAFAGHNLEEAAGLPGWTVGHGFVAPVDAAALSHAVLWLTIAAFVLLLAGRTVPRYRPLVWAVAIYAAALLFNVAAHLVVSLATWSYTPGLGTALALVLPSHLWLWRRLPLASGERLRAAIVGIVAMPVVAIAALTLSGAIG